MKIIQIGTGEVLWEGANLYNANLQGADLCSVSELDLTLLFAFAGDVEVLADWRD